MGSTLVELARFEIYIQISNLYKLRLKYREVSPEYVDSSAERITVAPTALGSDLKLYLRGKPVVSALSGASPAF
jgi:hypothetical protein